MEFIYQLAVALSAAGVVAIVGAIWHIEMRLSRIEGMLSVVLRAIDFDEGDYEEPHDFPDPDFKSPEKPAPHKIGFWALMKRKIMCVASRFFYKKT